MTARNLTLLPLAALAGFVLAAVPAQAALVATDLNAGGTETGFSGGWIGSSNVRITTAADLTYGNYGITQTGTPGNVYSANTASLDRQDARDLAAAMSGEIWFTVLVTVPAAGNFAGLSFNYLNPAQSYSHNQSALRIVMSPTELWVDWEGAGVNQSWTPDAAVGGFTAGTHLLLGQMTVAAGNDTLNVWVDPDVNAAGGPGGLPAATYSNTTVDFTDSIVSIGVPNSDSTGSDAVHIDAIRVSDTETAFADVTGVVPEPSSSLLLLAGSGFALTVRRRRNVR